MDFTQNISNRKDGINMKMVKNLAVTLFAVMMLSSLAISASAASTSTSLYKEDHSATTYTLEGRDVSCELVTYSTSNDGVNMDVYTSSGAKVMHAFAEPGHSDSTS